MSSVVFQSVFNCFVSKKECSMKNDKLNLAAYAAMAAALGASANGQIIDVDIDDVVFSADNLTYQLNMDGTNSTMVFNYFTSSSNAYGTSQLYMTTFANSKILAEGTVYYGMAPYMEWAYSLPEGYIVGAGSETPNPGSLPENSTMYRFSDGMNEVARLWGNPYGNADAWYLGNYDSSMEYLGIEFQLDGQTHYGWVDITTNYASVEGVDWDPSPTTYTISGWHYEDTPGASAVVVPEPATLSLLALGASGLLAHRRRKES